MAKTLAKLLLLLGCFTAASACSSKIQTTTIRWREEVKLENGETVIASQAEEYRPEEVAQAYGQFAVYWITIPLPNSPVTPITWEGHAKPLAVDTARDGTIYIVCSLTALESNRFYDLPRSASHVGFKFIPPKTWARVELGSIPPEIKPNLFIDTNKIFKSESRIKEGYTTSKIIGLQLKNEIDSDPSIDKSFRGWANE